MKSFKQFKNTKGITLIALVVTIVVLLILAAVSISMLTGENGIITQAQDSKDKTEQAKCEELVTVAINGLIAENSGDRSKITPEKIAEQVNKENNRTDVTAEGSTFPTNIIFNEEGRKVGVDIELGVTGEIKEEIYSADVSEEDIAPVDIFLYEIIDGTGETASTEWDSLPTKEARIVGIKSKYCNLGGYDPETGEKEYSDTNYEITLEDGTKITDTLIVPYQVEIDEEMYKITEVDLAIYGHTSNWTGYTLPNVKTIIYPNTVKIISGKNHSSGSGKFEDSSRIIEKIILPQNLEIIGDNAFMDCGRLTNIYLPHSVKIIGESAFWDCKSLNNIIIQNGVTTIEECAFYGCSSLTSIEIPSSVTSIGRCTFLGCESLISIEIPSSVTYIGENAFSECSSLINIEIPIGSTSLKSEIFRNCYALTSIKIPSSVTSIEEGAFSECRNLTTVNYTGTEEQWNNISIGSNNSYLRNAIINYNYKGE